MGSAPTEQASAADFGSDPGWVGRWLPVLLWAAVIWTFSTGWFDGDGTRGFLVPLLAAIFPFLTPEALEAVHQVLRKVAHLAEFAILAVLVARALLRPERNWIRVGFATVGICLMWAAVDEFHQTFVPTRTGAVQDVVLDTVGAGFGFLIYRWGRISSDRRLRV